jgi:hypothetical protein
MLVDKITEEIGAANFILVETSSALLRPTPLPT